METGPFDKIKILNNGQGDIKIDKPKKIRMIHSVSKLIHRERTYADDSAIYMHNHALSSIETHLLIPTFRKIRYTFNNPGHCFIFLCLSNSWQMNCVA